VAALSKVWVYGSISSSFIYSCVGLLLLCAENFYTTWQLRGTLKVFCNMHNKNIYNENWKIPAAWQQFSVCGSIWVTAWLCIHAAEREPWSTATCLLGFRFECCWGHGRLSLMNVVCCQVGVPVMGQSLVQRSPTKRGVSECDLETSTMRRPKPTRAVKPLEKTIKGELMECGQEFCVEMHYCNAPTVNQTSIFSLFWLYLRIL
jgi:hypothetical protein